MVLLVKHEMAFIRDDFSHDDVVSFHGNFRNNLNVPSCSNGSCLPFPAEETVVISRAVA